jgi:hypothetical protein
MWNKTTRAWVAFQPQEPCPAPIEREPIGWNKRYTLEETPSQGEHSETKWWWESISKFGKLLRSMLIDVIGYFQAITHFDRALSLDTCWIQRALWGKVVSTRCGERVNPFHPSIPLIKHQPNPNHGPQPFANPHFDGPNLLLPPRAPGYNLPWSGCCMSRALICLLPIRGVWGGGWGDDVWCMVIMWALFVTIIHIETSSGQRQRSHCTLIQPPLLTSVSLSQQCCADPFSIIAVVDRGVHPRNEHFYMMIYE